MSSNPKSAKTTERLAKKAKHREHSGVKPAKKPAPSALDKPRNVSFKNSEVEVGTSADVQVEDVSTEAGDAGLTSARAQQKISLPSSFKIIAGSYERLLYGLEGTVSVSSSAASELEWTLKPIFIFPAHVSHIKSVAASPQGGKWLASGSGDEIIKVWDLRRRKEVGGLMQHEGGFMHRCVPVDLYMNLTGCILGSITHLTFPSRSHLISASEDGTLCVFRARDWAVLRSLKGHKGRVNSVSVHPSGKVALSVGKDRTLYMWDLMRGRRAASMKLGFGESRTRRRCSVILKISLCRRRTSTVVDDRVIVDRSEPKNYQRLLDSEIQLPHLPVHALLCLRIWKSCIRWSTRLEYTTSSLLRELIEKARFFSLPLRINRQLPTKYFSTLIPSFAPSHTSLDTKIGAFQTNLLHFFTQEGIQG